MTEDEKYFFDLNGYLILRDVADPELVARCNAVIDHHDNQIKTAEREFEGSYKSLTSPVRQRWSDDIIRWDKPWREGFLDLLVHLRLKPYLSELLGSGYRMAYLPRLVMMDTGCAGH